MGIACLSFTVIPPEEPLPIKTITVTTRDLPPAAAPEFTNSANRLYAEWCLEDKGLSAAAFSAAWKGYLRLMDKGLVSRDQVLTICDFSQPSSRKRLYILDTKDGRLLVNTYVAHGRNSGGEYATRFSNTPESLQSSLGFYITRQTYTGAHGISMRLEGVDPGFNDQAYARSIVMHGATYVDAARARSGIMMGRSFGCPAVPQAEAPRIISLIREGSCLFIYHPLKQYQERSRLLND